jgi:microcystin-dependent protein
MFGGTFAPSGWMLCDGQLLAISEFDTLFNLIGTTYGGDGQSTFALPNLQSRVPIHMGTQAGTTYQIGQAAGVENVTLTVQQIPVHNHAMVASGDQADQITGKSGVVAAPPTLSMYFTAPPDTSLNANTMTPVGGSQPHDNLQPYTCINFIISLFGIFPHTGADPKPARK